MTRNAPDSRHCSKVDGNGFGPPEPMPMRVLDSKSHQLAARVKNDPELGEILFTTLKDLAKEQKALEAEIEAFKAKSFKTKTPAATTRELLDLTLAMKTKISKEVYITFRFMLRSTIKELFSRIVFETKNDGNNKTGVNRTCNVLIEYRNSLFQRFQATRGSAIQQNAAKPDSSLKLLGSNV